MPAGIARSQTSKQLLAAGDRPSVRRQRRRPRPAVRRARGRGAAYGTIYFGDADALMHMAGPDAPEVAALMEEHLSAIAAAPWPEGTLVLLTADHGMEGISPERTTYVNVVWPELAQHMAVGADGKPLAPAGSCRDLFLHVLPERLDEVEARLCRAARRRRRGADGRGAARRGTVRVERHRGADVAAGEPRRPSGARRGRLLARAGPLRADASSDSTAGCRPTRWRSRSSAGSRAGSYPRS